ncbi:alpha/beta hydrolase fold domain-containing protein [Mycobacterium vicinigordonae]|uniref:alpha/beta hydrolase fold domain-containing protein n=1 Tax=Mycobacterium vicinigordonae TaxID=1719132 RepID=UPI001FEBBB02|nr:alpha/beta hydrolase fold domain-containing protein [Mycobacterium vicinigordonae]
MTGTTVEGLVLPGRLGNPDLTFGEDPRADPRLVAALARFGLDGHSDLPPVTPNSPSSDILNFANGLERQFQGLFDALFADVAPAVGVNRDEVTISAPDGHQIRLYIHAPADRGSGRIPCIVHFHGGGMSIITAADRPYVVFRDALAECGSLVIGVEFRNAAGCLGHHPFPAGLDDCESALRWVFNQRAALGVGAITLVGESGGGNLALSLALRAVRDGWAQQIGGVYAQCPFISNQWSQRPLAFPSMRENDAYVVSCALLAILGATYDPTASHSSDPTCWPLMARDDELTGLPPHVISLNELDPLRDEGLAYMRRLRTAGVSVVGRTVHGTCHAADIMFGPVIPDIFAASVGDVSRFAHFQSTLGEIN